jgi:exodeoxyribonuclease VII small subunit
MNKKSNATKPFNFEKAMEELEKIVLQMESGDFELEESIKQFERGVALTKLCQTALSKAEQKVLQLSSDAENQPVELIDFEPSTTDDTHE